MKCSKLFLIARLLSLYISPTSSDYHVTIIRGSTKFGLKLRLFLPHLSFNKFAFLWWDNDDDFCLLKILNPLILHRYPRMTPLFTTSPIGVDGRGSTWHHLPRLSRLPLTTTCIRQPLIRPMAVYSSHPPRQRREVSRSSCRQPPTRPSYPTPDP